MIASERLPLELAAFRSALIVKPSSLGDIVHTLPAVRLIKQAHSHLRLRWIANTEWTPLLHECPFVDEVIPFPRKTFRGLAGLARFVKWAAERNRDEREVPEIVLDFQGLFRSGLISTSRGADRVIGLSNSREGAAKFCDHIVAVDPAAHAVDQNLAMAPALGVSFSPEDVVFPLPQGEPLPRTGGVALDDGNFILIHPWSRGEGKSLTAPVLQALCDCLPGQHVVIVGVQAARRAPSGARVTDLTNQTSLAQLLWLMRRAQA